MTDYCAVLGCHSLRQRTGPNSRYRHSRTSLQTWVVARLLAILLIASTSTEITSRATAGGLRHRSRELIDGDPLLTRWILYVLR